MLKKLIHLGCLLAAVTLSVICFNSSAHPHHTSVTRGKGGGGWPSSTAFTFTYNVGDVTNYHAFGVAGQAGIINQPPGTTNLLYWYVLDLGPVSGTGTVSCPAEELYPNTGILMFAAVTDLYTNGIFTDTNGMVFEIYTNPIPMVQVETAKGNNTTAVIQVAVPQDNDSDDTAYPILYNGPFFTPFSWDLSAWVWDAEPATWP